jgi:DNA-directed RNA polymerase specialized sigma24 family protein
VEQWRDLEGATDAELVAALAQGDLDALEVLYRRHQPWLAVRLTRRCNDRDVVADVLPDTFVAAIWPPALAENL